MSFYPSLSAKTNSPLTRSVNCERDMMGIAGLALEPESHTH